MVIRARCWLVFRDSAYTSIGVAMLTTQFRVKPPFVIARNALREDFGCELRESRCSENGMREGLAVKEGGWWFLGGAEPLNGYCTYA